MCKWAAARHRFWCTIAGADIPVNCSIGGGLLIPHPNGIVIHPKVTIGVNCLIFQQVTIGTRGSIQVPEIGGHVDIGAGAKILGAVKIGAHAQIGANAVVVADVPSRGIAVGIPAKLL
jgi:serine O-acetyltransferase